MSRKLILAWAIVGMLLAPIVWGADPGLFFATGLTGGLTGCLDKINSTTGKAYGGSSYPLETGDGAIVVIAGGTWFYRYDASSTAAEETTNYTVIKPDNLGAGDPGRWIKKYHTTSWKAAAEVTISTGTAALSGQGNYKIAGEGGVDDDLDTLTGLEEGHEAILAPTSGDVTITVKHGNHFKLQGGKDFVMNNEHDRIRVLCIGSDICVELQRSSGGD